MNVITGTPRSGSTLLCNILRQNPDYQVESSMPLSALLSALSMTASNSPDMLAAYVADRAVYARLQGSMRAFCDAWYPAQKTVFDKNRLWAVNAMLLRELYPEARIIVVVRDLRDVVASLEKQHRKQPLFDKTPLAHDKTLYKRSSGFMEHDGLVGSAAEGVEDLLRRKPGNIVWMRYEDLVTDPGAALRLIDDFDYDFAHIVNGSQEADAFYLDKFPHEGAGEIRRDGIGYWHKYLDEALARDVQQRYPFYTQSLRYT